MFSEATSGHFAPSEQWSAARYRRVSLSSEPQVIDAVVIVRHQNEDELLCCYWRVGGVSKSLKSTARKLTIQLGMGFLNSEIMMIEMQTLSNYTQ
jgi:hypothetical protein